MVVTRGIAELPCRLVDPDLFFAEAPADVEEAKALCLDCPVRAVCLAGALQRRVGRFETADGVTYRSRFRRE